MIIVNWTIGNKLQWTFNRNLNIFIQENAFENVVCKMASICLDLNVLKAVQKSDFELTKYISKISHCKLFDFIGKGIP